ncbi:MAG: hypothetical protein O2931_16415, partial [Planctomycetota bacterium]|nr:hypothetical protein [Planctomycetota bacterium]
NVYASSASDLRVDMRKVCELTLYALSMVVASGWNACPAASPSSGFPSSQGVSPTWPREPWSSAVELPNAAPDDGLSGIVRRLLLENIPETYEDTRKWGKTAKRWDGLHVHHDGLRVKTKRRWKEVNHGLWQMFRITPRDPEHSLHLQINNLKETSPGVITFDVDFTAHVDALARRSRWNYGVQLYSISMEAEAVVELQAQVELRTKLDLAHFPPDLELHPRVLAAKLNLREYHVRKISKIGGDLAEEIGGTLEHLLAEKLEDKQQKIVDRMNRQIEKNQSKLRVSVRDLVGWLPSPSQ